MNRFYTITVAITAALLISAGCSSSDPVDDDAPVEPHPLGDLEEEEEVEEEEVADETDDQAGVLHKVAIAEMHSGDGDKMGEVMFTQTEEGVEVHGRIESLDGDLRGFHVHEHGECDPPDFESAGGHFNPGGHPHGAPDAPAHERHAGDFGNLEFDDDGVAEFAFVDDVITLGAGENDVTGKALIVHYEADDLETQPTGDAGPRAGCGIIEPSGGEEESADDGLEEVEAEAEQEQADEAQPLEGELKN